MNVRIRRIDPSIPLPSYQTSGAVAFDIASRKTIDIPPKSLARIPTNLIIEVPPGYMLAVVPRSSTPSKKGLLIPHGIGIIDQDYCGPNDEILLQVFNFTEKNVIIERGERIGQGSFVRVDKAEWTESDELKITDRGGFGSTS